MEATVNPVLDNEENLPYVCQCVIDECNHEEYDDEEEDEDEEDYE